jgi:NADP-dependent 3-hydroxy acid dehydrogenase YdfG
MTVYAIGRDAQRLAAAVQSVPIGRRASVRPHRCDLTSSAEIAALAKSIEEEVGGVDLLVHAAGNYRRGRHMDASIEDLEALFASNVRGPYELTRRLLPMLRNSCGDIVSISSTQALSAGEGVGQYAATHHAMKAVADSLRGEVNPDVRVMMLHLGPTAGPRQAQLFSEEGRSYAPDLLIQPEDVAAVVATAVALPRRAQLTALTLWPTRRF